MKSLTMNLMSAAAALVASAASGAASSLAKAPDMKVEIPFAFQAGGKVLAPGTYKVSSPSGGTFRLSNAPSGDGVYLNALAPHDPAKEWSAQDAGVLQFACTDSQCALTQLWTGKGHPAHYVSNPHPQEGKPTHMALIRAAVSK